MFWVPVTGPVGLGFSICSYAGQLSVALTSDTYLLPDRDRLLALLDDEVRALRARRPLPAHPRRGAELPDAEVLR